MSSYFVKIAKKTTQSEPVGKKDVLPQADVFFMNIAVAQNRAP